MVLGEGGEKMSKSRGNVINPDIVVKENGADVFRIYEMFIGPFDQSAAWDTKGIVGVSRFLNRVWNMIANSEISDTVRLSAEQLRILHQTVKKVGKDIETLDLNTAVSQMMIFVNEFSKSDTVHREAAEAFVKILSPFAPHIAEELWSILGKSGSVAHEPWPAYNEDFIRLDEVEILVQVNGKPKVRTMMKSDVNDDEMKNIALSLQDIQNELVGKTPKKVICVKGRLVNIVV